jgi:AcrR family transcriptional regulator
MVGVKPAEDGRVLRAREMREERRAQILDAARRVFAKKGYVGGSIADIIEEAQIARGTFYLHFESKREVFSEVLDEMLGELRKVITRVDVALEATPYEQLLENVVRVLTVLVDKADVARILLRPEGGQDPELSARVDEFYDHAIAMISGSLSDGIEMGMVRPIEKKDVEMYAACVLGSIKESVDRLLSRRARKKSDVRALAKRLLDYNMYGILTR